jgi:hypothetical protein
MRDMKKKKEIASGKVIYTGTGFIQGIPARDMDLGEWEAYPEALREAALDCGIYLMGAPVEELEAEAE